MKKFYFLIILALILGLVLSGCLLSNVGQVPDTSQTKVKPEGLGGAQTYAWHLSGAVMPVPPYGSKDILGSDTASKLIVNQPNGAVEVTITGVMNGLDPNKTYTVYLSKPYTPYVFTGWSIEGNWIFRGMYYGGEYDHDYTLIHNIGEVTFTGTGGYPASGPPYSITETVTGTIDAIGGTIILFYTDYDNSSYWAKATGTINPDGTITGTWGNTSQGYGHLWYSISGNAVKTHTGDDWHTGLFYNQQTFTFMTDADGSGSWHINLRDSDFPTPDTYALSVWINQPGATILISDNFEVIVE